MHSTYICIREIQYYRTSKVQNQAKNKHFSFLHALRDQLALVVLFITAYRADLSNSV